MTLPCGLSARDWLIDGRPVPSDVWDALDWSRAYMDMGPSPAGNPGPYWHVPRTDADTVHRLYPRLLNTRWAPLVQHAVEEATRQADSETLQRQVRELQMEVMQMRMQRTEP